MVTFKMHDKDGSKTWFVDVGNVRFECATRKAADELEIILRTGGILEISIKPIHLTIPISTDQV